MKPFGGCPPGPGWESSYTHAPVVSNLVSSPCKHRPSAYMFVLKWNQNKSPFLSAFLKDIFTVLRQWGLPWKSLKWYLCTNMFESLTFLRKASRLDAISLNSTIWFVCLFSFLDAVSRVFFDSFWTSLLKTDSKLNSFCVTVGSLPHNTKRCEPTVVVILRYPGFGCHHDNSQVTLRYIKGQQQDKSRQITDDWVWH